MEIKKVETLFKKYYNLEEITLEHEGATFTRERLNKKSAVAAVVFNTDTDKFIFVEQFRAGTLSNLVEIVAGTLKEGEDPAECMKREVEEEIGYKVDRIDLLHSNFYMSPGYTNEKMTIFYCEVSEKVNDGGGLADEHEHITIIEMNLLETVDNLANDYFKDSKTIIGLTNVLL